MSLNPYFDADLLCDLEQFVVFHLLICVQLFATPWTAAHQATLSFTISQSFLKLMSIELVMPANHLICHSLLLSSVFPSNRVFSNELALCVRWPKCWSFSIRPSNKYSGLISFKIFLSKDIFLSLNSINLQCHFNE